MHEADRHKVRGFDVRTSRQIGQINSDAVVVVFSLCIDPAGNILAVADGDAVWLFDAHSFERIQKISVDTDNVDSVAFSPGGNRLAIGGRALLTIVRPKKQN